MKINHLDVQSNPVNSGRAKNANVPLYVNLRPGLFYNAETLYRPHLKANGAIRRSVSRGEETRARNVFRSWLKKLPAVRSTYYLSVVLRQMAEDQWASPSSFDEIFSASSDPWESTTAREQERFAVTLQTLAASRTSRFNNAVELGCAEGIFTELLAPLCNKLVALDYSQVALDRARTRLGSSHSVNFGQWDMRHEKLPGSFDLVVAMGVLTSLYRPGDVRKTCDMIVGAVEPGGFLLFSDVRQSPVFETAWWGRYVLRGGEQIRRLLLARSDLEQVSRDDTASHVFALFRKVARK
jgi:2-polyprenyl-3-methyl-5-hydroxy-6-metoxy-1,4-benzoquinol methylase